jgi:hypothetical protein
MTGQLAELALAPALRKSCTRLFLTIDAKVGVHGRIGRIKAAMLT